MAIDSSDNLWIFGGFTSAGGSAVRDDHALIIPRMNSGSTKRIPTRGMRFQLVLV